VIGSEVSSDVDSGPAVTVIGVVNTHIITKTIITIKILFNILTFPLIHLRKIHSFHISKLQTLPIHTIIHDLTIQIRYSLIIQTILHITLHFSHSKTNPASKRRFIRDSNRKLRSVRVKKDPSRSDISNTIFIFEQLNAVDVAVRFKHMALDNVSVFH
jgi:hypothetical protein